LKKYLLDTNSCIYFIKGLFQLRQKTSEVGEENCFISEITIAELKFGIENSKTPDKIKFIARFPVTSIYDSLDIYAKEKARLRKAGSMIDDFDILIGCSAIANNMIMVANNTSHFNRLENIQIEYWTLNAR
jgi:tRNA(fMet)-specific endonuclease VapC